MNKNLPLVGVEDSSWTVFSTFRHFLLAEFWFDSVSPCTWPFQRLAAMVSVDGEIAGVFVIKESLVEEKNITILGGGCLPSSQIINQRLGTNVAQERCVSS